MEKLQHLRIPLDEIKLATGNFSDQNSIGRGGFGKVYIGKLTNSGQQTSVAVKRLDRTLGQGYHEFLMEIQMLSCYSHKNLISLLGFCEESGENILVYEHAKHGSLDTYLAKDELSWVQRLKISLGAARGFNYLHNDVGSQHRVLHRDIKSSNILLDENWEAKISDFGLSKIGLSNVDFTFLVTNVCGTHGYIDPQYRKTGILTKESDVYSFGVVLFEILCGRPSLIITYQDERRFLDSLAQHSYEQNTLHEIILPSIKNEIKVDSLTIFSVVAYQCLNENRTERPTMEWIVDKLEEALEHQVSQSPTRSLTTMFDSKAQRPPIEPDKGSINALIKCVMKDIGFSQGKPVAAFTIYKCLIHWKSFEAERTSVFNRLLLIIASAIEDEDNNVQMAYWLSNACTLLFLLQRSIKPPPPTSLFKRITMGFSSTLSTVNLAAAAAAASASLDQVIHQVEPEYPALLFRQQLTAYVEKMYVIIRDSLKMELGPFLSLCIQAPRASMGVVPSNHWQSIIGCLNTLLNTLKENFVPPVIIQKLFAHIFSYVNAELFNSLLVRRECCSFSNGEYVKSGLAELELWCSQTKEEYAGSAWDELKHTRQAIGFLVIHQKYKLSYDEIINDLCPILSIQHLYRICLFFWDDKYNNQSISRDVLLRMRILVTKNSHNAGRNSFLLDDDSSIPFSLGDLSCSLQVKEFTDVKPALELAENPAFQFLNSKARGT